MGPDELAHVQRADLTTFGRLTGERVEIGGEVLAGGRTDLSIADAARRLEHIQGHPERRVSRDDLRRAAAVRFDGRTGFGFFPNTAAQSPALYLPASAALALAKALDRSIVEALTWARVATAVCCCLIGFVALRLAGRVRLALFALLMLPMSTSLFGSVTSDGLLIVSTALAVAIVSSAASHGRALRPGETLIAIAALACVGMAKPPYIAFGLVLAAVPTQGWPRGLSALLAFLAPAAWTVAAAIFTTGPLGRPDVATDALGQADWLLRHLDALPAIAISTLAAYGRNYAVTFIGVLGWLDTPLWSKYYLACGLALVLAWAICAGRAQSRAVVQVKLSAVGAAVIAAGAVFLAMYLTWTPVGAADVQGVQGRYFIPVAIVAALALEGGRTLWPDRRLVRTGLEFGGAAVLLFPILSGLLVADAISGRFYGT